MGDRVAPDFEPSVPRRLPRGVVYYAVRLSDGAVKVGFTTKRPADRMRHLARSFGPMVLLATEPGTAATETDRHERFRRLRMPDQGCSGGTEFFHGAPTLVRRIEALRAAGGAS